MVSIVPILTRSALGAQQSSDLDVHVSRTEKICGACLEFFGHSALFHKLKTAVTAENGIIESYTCDAENDCGKRTSEIVDACSSGCSAIVGAGACSCSTYSQFLFL